MYLMNRLYSILFLALGGLIGCTEKKEVVDSNLKSFKVEGVMSRHDLQFAFPKTFISVKDIDIGNIKDTTNVQLTWILSTQYDHPEASLFYDSMDLKLNVYVRAGPRVDISTKGRKLTYFTVPTAPLHKIFPAASDRRKIIYDSGEKKYKDKTYYKRKYQIIPDSLGFQEYYYLSTKWQSVLVIVNSVKETNLDKYILDYELRPKPKPAN
jgi:hypothetical protein